MIPRNSQWVSRGPRKRLSTLHSRYDIIYETSYSLSSVLLHARMQPDLHLCLWVNLRLRLRLGFRVKVRVRGQRGKFRSHVWRAAQVPLPLPLPLLLPLTSPRVGVRVRLGGSRRGVGHRRGGTGRLKGVRAVVWCALGQGSVGVGLGRRVSLDRIGSAALF